MRHKNEDKLFHEVLTTYFFPREYKELPQLNKTYEQKHKWLITCNKISSAIKITEMQVKAITKCYFTSRRTKFLSLTSSIEKM